MKMVRVFIAVFSVEVFTNLIYYVIVQVRFAGDGFVGK
mgnify:CR=1 FL=1